MKKSELLKLITDLQERVRLLELNQQTSTQIKWNSQDPVWIPSVWSYPDTCIDGQQHAYPTTWGGVLPPSCTRCGKCASTGVTWTSSNTLTVYCPNPNMEPIDSGSWTASDITRDDYLSPFDKLSLALSG